MRKIDDHIPSKSNYLKKEDVGETGRDLVIKDFRQEDIGTDGGEKETKLVIYWTDPSFKPMVINKENGSRLKMVLKTDDMDLMIGKTVNVYSDPFVAFGGKTVGGTRIRAPQQAARANSLPGKVTARTAPVVEDDGPDAPPLEAYDLEAYDDENVPF
jgi:hypothetical protein